MSKENLELESTTKKKRRSISLEDLDYNPMPSIALQNKIKFLFQNQNDDDIILHKYMEFKTDPNEYIRNICNWVLDSDKKMSFNERSEVYDYLYQLDHGKFQKRSKTLWTKVREYTLDRPDFESFNKFLNKFKKVEKKKMKEVIKKRRK